MGNDIREWVDGQRAALAKRAFQFVEQNKDIKIKEALQRLDPTPLRVVLGAAASASCLDEVLVLLHYQHGRDSERWPKDLVTAIDKELRAAVEDAAAKPGKPSDFDAVEAMLATVFLGFVVQLHRYYHPDASKAMDPANAAKLAPAVAPASAQHLRHR